LSSTRPISVAQLACFPDDWRPVIETKARYTKVLKQKDQRFWDDGRTTGSMDDAETTQWQTVWRYGTACI